MEKRRIKPDLAIQDIRSGVTEGEMMVKYHLSPKGLQSLFNKLVHAGFIELEELDQKMPTFMGTVFVPETETGRTSPREGDSSAEGAIGLSEVLADIKSGLDDQALMKRYHLSARGLQSVFDHLVFTGLMTQAEVDERFAPLDSTVDVHGFHGRVKAPDSKEHPWECPACGRSQPHEMDECPVCGVIVKKYLEKVAREKGEE